MGLAWYGRAIGVWMSHWGPDIPSRSRCPTMAWVFHHDSAMLSLPALPCHHGPAVSLGPRCLIGVQMFLLGSRCLTMVQMFHHNPDILSPLVLLCCHGPGVSSVLSPVTPPRSWIWTRLWTSHHGLGVPSQSSPAIMIWSCCATMVWPYLWVLDVLPWSRHLCVIHPWCHHPPLLSS